MNNLVTSEFVLYFFNISISYKIMNKWSTNFQEALKKLL